MKYVIWGSLLLSATCHVKDKNHVINCDKVLRSLSACRNLPLSELGLNLNGKRCKFIRGIGKWQHREVREGLHCEGSEVSHLLTSPRTTLVPLLKQETKKGTIRTNHRTVWKAYLLIYFFLMKIAFLHCLVWFVECNKLTIQRITLLYMFKLCRGI